MSEQLCIDYDLLHDLALISGSEACKNFIKLKVIEVEAAKALLLTSLSVWLN